MLEIKKCDKVVAPIIGANGNIFNIMAIASKALRSNGQIDQSKQMIEEVQQCHSYDQALEVISKYVIFGDSGNEQMSLLRFPSI